jgi:hypothetical protein
VPTEAIASCAGDEAVLDGLGAALAPLNDVVDFPVAGQVAIDPSALLELDGIATEVAVPARLVPNLPSLLLGHHHLPVETASSAT